MSGFPMLTVNDLVNAGEAAIQTGPFGTQLAASEYVHDGIPVINVRNIGFGRIRDADLEFLNESKAYELRKHQLKVGDIVFGRKGAVERHVLIDQHADGWIQGSDCLRLRLSGKRVHPRFLSYFFTTKAHQDWMQALCSFGATMSSLNQDIVKRISFPCPPLETQRKIAGILSAYDDLIENNRRRIAILERMAEELYREWFVRMRFPGYQNTKFVKGVPEGWEQRKLGEVITLNYGKALKAEYRVTGPYPVYGSSGIVGTHIKPLVDRPGLIVGRKGNVGSVYYSDLSFYPIDTAYYVESKLADSYLYHLLSSMNFINNDAAVPGLNRNQAYSNLLLLPQHNLIEAFEDLVGKLVTKTRKLRDSISLLTSVRENLLNRLVSGKLRVTALDIRIWDNDAAISAEMEQAHA